MKSDILKEGKGREILWCFDWLYIGTFALIIQGIHIGIRKKKVDEEERYEVFVTAERAHSGLRIRGRILTTGVSITFEMAQKDKETKCYRSVEGQEVMSKLLPKGIQLEPCIKEMSGALFIPIPEDGCVG